MPDDPMFANKNHWCHSLPAGRLGEMLAHPIYIMQAILGQLKVRSVQAMTLGSYPWVRFDELRVSLDANKGSASIYASFNSFRADVLIDIYGTQGMLQIDLDSDTLVQLKSGTELRIRAFIDSVLDDKISGQSKRGI